jgi:hypothetical protein
MLTIGSTLVIYTPPKCETEHLYIIIAIQKSTGKALVVNVNVTSFKKGCDTSCILRIGQHKFLKHTSIINYADAQIVEISILDDLLKRELIKPHDPVSSIQLKKIQQCGLTSSALPTKFLDFLSSNI